MFLLTVTEILNVDTILLGMLERLLVWQLWFRELSVVIRGVWAGRAYVDAVGAQVRQKGFMALVMTS